MKPRLSSSVLVGSLLRLAEGDGGFGTVITKGDPDAGAVFILLLERGQPVQVLERLLQADGDYAWQASGAGGAQNEEKIAEFLQKRRRFDPDCWIVELDIASAERFADEIRAFD